MKKFILAGMAVAMLAIPAVASADVRALPGADATLTATLPDGQTVRHVAHRTRSRSTRATARSPASLGLDSAGLHEREGHRHDRNGP